MSNLSVTFLGLPIKNPVIAASSGLTSTREGVLQAVKAGAGAIVLKSLFEEQLRAEFRSMAHSAHTHPELDAYFSGSGIMASADAELELVRSVKMETDTPVIASINCTGESFWTDFAAQLESVGADALELNFGFVPIDTATTAAGIETKLVSLVTSVTKTVKIPVCAKLGAAYTNIGNVASRLAAAGAKGVTLFNRFYRMDVDLEKMALKPGPMKSSSDAYHEALRWIALLDGRIQADICASGGVYDALSALRLIAVGAAAVQVCSLMYTKGYDALRVLLDEMNVWLDSHNVSSIGDMRSQLARRNSLHPEEYGRLQYIRALTGQH